MSTSQSFTLNSLTIATMTDLCEQRVFISDIDAAVSVREALNGMEPEVIYTKDAFEVTQDLSLTSFVDSGAVDEMVASFEGCSNAAQCVEREANAIISAAYDMLASALADNIAELVDVIKEVSVDTCGKTLCPDLDNIYTSTDDDQIGTNLLSDSLIDENYTYNIDWVGTNIVATLRNNLDCEAVVRLECPLIEGEA